MKPGDAVLRIFSNMKPINTGDRFIDEKERAKLVFSNRMFNRKPNGKLFFIFSCYGSLSEKSTNIE